MQDHLGRTTQFRYDLAGRLDTIQDAEGQLIQYEYYDNDWLRLIDYRNPNKPTADVTFTYYGRGLRRTMVDGTGTTTYDYDSLDRLASVDRRNELINGGSPDERRKVAYEYDLAGNIVKIVYPARPGQQPQSVTRTFDTANRMDTLTNFYGNVSDFAYDANGNLVAIDYTNTDPDLNTQTLIGYDALNLVDTITHTQKAIGYTLFAVDYTRDSRTLVQTSRESAEGETIDRLFDYDALGRIKTDMLTATNPLDNARSTWVYDADSQIRQSSVLRNTQVPIVTTRIYDAAGQLSDFEEKQGLQTVNHFTFQFDSTGNRTLTTDVAHGNRTTAYTYDQANRLKTFDDWVDYAYDGEGLRQYKCAGQTCYDHFSWDIVGGVPLLLQDARAQYVYGPGGILLANDNDRPNGQVPQRPGEPEKGVTASPRARGEEPGSPGPDTFSHYYYLLDQQGSVRGMVEDGGGVVIRYDYDAYGRQTPYGGIEPYNRFGFTGQYRDEESDMWFMRGRYYDAVTQQFLSRDPLEAASGQPYVYAGGDPVNYNDPTGNFRWRASMFMGSDPIPGGPDELPGIGGKGPGSSGRPAPSPGGAQASGATGRLIQQSVKLAKSWGHTVATSAGAGPTKNGYSKKWVQRGFEQANPEDIDDIFRIAKEIGMEFEVDPAKDGLVRGGGRPGLASATHAEIIRSILMYKGKVPKGKIVISHSGGPCATCVEWFTGFASYTGEAWRVVDSKGTEHPFDP